MSWGFPAKEITFGLGLLGASLVYSGQPSAKLDEQCKALPSQIQEAHKHLPDQDRMVKLTDLKILITAIKSLDVKKTSLPSSYWQRCLDKSVEVLRAHTMSANPGLRLQKNYLVLISELQELQGNKPQALSTIDDAIKQDGTDPYLRIRAVRLWLAIEEKRAKEMPKSSSGIPGSQQVMKKRMDEYLGPILRETRSHNPERVAALQIHGEFLESLGDLDAAQKDWLALLDIDPKNIRVLRKLAAFEHSKGNLSGTITHLRKIIEIDPSDLGAQKQLIKIYVDQKDYRAAKSQSRIALKYYPRDEELRSILNL